MLAKNKRSTCSTGDGQTEKPMSEEALAGTHVRAPSGNLGYLRSHRIIICINSINTLPGSDPKNTARVWAYHQVTLNRAGTQHVC